MFIFADFSKMLFGNETITLTNERAVAEQMLNERRQQYADMGCEIKPSENSFIAIMRSETGSDILRVYTQVIIAEVTANSILSVVHICDPDEREIHSEIERFEYELEEADGTDLENDIKFFQRKVETAGSYYCDLQYTDTELFIDYERDFITKRIGLFLLSTDEC